MHSNRSFKLSCLALVLLVGFSAQAFSATTNAVGTCTPPVPPAHTYATIQLAVSSSPAGAIIQICPGNYPEQVTIVRNVTLEGVLSATVQNAAVILPPAGGMVANATDLDSGFPIAAQILVTTAKTVKISNLTVDGTGNQIANCSPDLQGITFQNASGTLNHVAVRNQLPSDVLSGCQIGEGIYVQTAAGFTSKLSVTNSSVHSYNKNGITANDFNTTLILTSDNIQGSGLSAIAAQNGVQICCGATGTMGSNVVFDNVYFDPASYAAADILLYDTKENSGVKINSNTVGNSQLPIALETDFFYGPTAYGDGVTITNNRIIGTSAYDAIDVCTNGNTVTGNNITNSAESGVHLDAACGTFFGGPATGNNNNASSNTFLESSCAGILADPGTSGNTTNSETYFAVPFNITNTTGSCSIPFTPARQKTMHKVSPKR